MALDNLSYNPPLDDKDETNDEGVNDVNDPEYDARTKPERPGYRKWKAPVIRPSTVIEGKHPKRTILSEVTLSIHNGQDGKTLPTEEHIHEWSND